MEIVSLIIGFMAFIFVGLFFALLTDRKAVLISNLQLTLSLSFLAGLGLISQQMFFYLLAKWKLNPSGIFMPWILLMVALQFVPYFRRQLAILRQSIKWKRPHQFSLFSSVLFLIIAFQVIFTFTYASLPAINGWDVWAIWFFKAKAFFLMDHDAFGAIEKHLSEYGHPHAINYPLLIPLSVTLLFKCLGSMNDFLVRALFPAFFLSMLSIFYVCTARLTSKRHATLFTAFLSTIPMVIIHTSGLLGDSASPKEFPLDSVGYADFPLAVFFLAAVSLLVLGSREKNPYYFYASAFFFGLSAWVKNEGVVFALIGYVVILIYAIIKKNFRLREILCISSLMAVSIIPWYAWLYFGGIQNQYAQNLNLSILEQLASNIGQISKYFINTLFKEMSLFNVVWWVYVLSVWGNRRYLLHSSNLIMNVLLCFQLAAYFSIYIITPAPLEWQLQTSLNRLVLHLTPLALFATAVNVHQICNSKEC